MCARPAKSGRNDLSKHSPSAAAALPAHTVTRKYYHAGGRAVALRTGGDPAQSGLYYLLADHLGSTTVTLKDTGSGLTKTGELCYKPWGEIRASSGTTPTGRHFTGQIEESGAGLYFYNARWYDGVVGRFVQADPLIADPYNPLDWDRYSYTRNNPIRYTDPTGYYAASMDGGSGTCKNSLDCVYWEEHEQAGYPILSPSTAERRRGGQIVGTGLSFIPGLDAGDDVLTLLSGCGYACQLGGEDPVSLGERAWAWAGLVLPVSGSNLRRGLGAGEQAFVAFTSRNFRENLRRFTGNSPVAIVGMEAHHVLPQAFEKQILDMAPEINIHDPVFGAWVDATTHRRWSFIYNEQWRGFLSKEPTREDILNFARDLAKEFRFDVYFGNP